MVEGNIDLFFTVTPSTYWTLSLSPPYAYIRRPDIPCIRAHIQSVTQSRGAARFSPSLSLEGQYDQYRPVLLPHYEDCRHLQSTAPNSHSIEINQNVTEDISLGNKYIVD